MLASGRGARAASVPPVLPLRGWRVLGVSPRTDGVRTPGSQSQFGLYRLPQGSTQWQSVGPTFGSNAFFFAPTPNGGVLWAYAAGRIRGG